MLSNVKFPVRPIDGEGADRPFLVVAHAGRLIGGIETGSGRHSEPGSSGLCPSRGCRRAPSPAGAIDPEKVYAPAIAGGQIHLRRQHVAER